MSVVSSIRNIEEQGFRLQLVMGAVTPPTSMKLAHEKIMECYNNTTAGMSIMVNFIEICNLSMICPIPMFACVLFLPALWLERQFNQAAAP